MLILSSRAVRLYRVQFDDCWASPVLACSPAVLCLTACSCSYSREFVFGPFALAPHGFRTWPLTTVAVIDPVGNFHPERITTCRAHELADDARAPDAPAPNENPPAAIPDVSDDYVPKTLRSEL